MELLLGDDAFQADDDITDLCHVVERTLNYSAITVDHYLFREGDHLQDVILANCSISRATNLIRLHISNEYPFFFF
jgi:hypothetical protein